MVRERRLLGAPRTHVAQKEDMAMRTAFDFSPLYRSSIGFDRVFDLLENASRATTIDNWPPYDIARTGEDDYRITMAVAGFSQDELSMTQEQNMLVVSGQKSGEDTGEFLHRGIAGRTFQRRFQLAGERLADDRSQARNSGRDEAAPDRDRQRHSRAEGRAT
jgi:HSP20 family molecular chaperone IbpA